MLAVLIYILNCRNSSVSSAARVCRVPAAVSKVEIASRWASTVALTLEEPAAVSAEIADMLSMAFRVALLAFSILRMLAEMPATESKSV